MRKDTDTELCECLRAMRQSTHTHQERLEPGHCSGEAGPLAEPSREGLPVLAEVRVPFCCPLQAPGPPALGKAAPGLLPQESPVWWQLPPFCYNDDSRMREGKDCHLPPRTLSSDCQDKAQNPVCVRQSSFPTTPVRNVRSRAGASAPETAGCVLRGLLGPFLRHLSRGTGASWQSGHIPASSLSKALDAPKIKPQLLRIPNEGLQST